jgi:hypothetical protein
MFILQQRQARQRIRLDPYATLLSRYDDAPGRNGLDHEGAVRGCEKVVGLGLPAIGNGRDE